jgi:hypothetical protein
MDVEEESKRVREEPDEAFKLEQDAASSDATAGPSYLVEFSDGTAPSNLPVTVSERAGRRSGGPAELVGPCAS